MAMNNTFIRKNRILTIVRRTLVWLVLFYLRFFAQLALFFFKGTSIGIAGAVGKSTARNALSSILKTYDATKVVSGNSETGIPLGILNLSIGTYSAFDWIRMLFLAPFHIFSLHKVKFLIVEMGIDGPKAPKNMGYLLTIIKPDIGILLNESPAHVGNYEYQMGEGSVTERLERVVTFMTNDDGKLLTHAYIKTAIINGDDTHITAFASTLPKTIVRTIGNEKNYDVTLSHHEVTDTGTIFEFSIHSFQEKEDIMLKFPHMVLPIETGVAIGSAILAAVSLNVPLSTTTINLQQYFSLPPGRGSILRGKNTSIIFDSSYNASSSSVLSFVRLMKVFKQTTRRPTIAVLGDMKELGSFSAYEHELVAREIPGSVDHVILVGPLTKELMLPYLTKYQSKFQTLLHVPTSRDVGVYLSDHLPDRAVILFKGSQLLEEAIKYILVDATDIQKLCRQDAFWKTAKKKHNTWVSLP